ncbi:hypothetical protein MG293_010140 [Ovis ammon polii]|uniref:Corticoliberin n=1 Tax=Ovis ammon polii TaxID=230172 RepID=A0AAD4U8X8_OVIAM|nr:hypothetical protein MG293_010140 [Ovis ammon polii]
MNVSPFDWEVAKRLLLFSFQFRNQLSGPQGFCKAKVRQPCDTEQESEAGSGVEKLRAHVRGETEQEEKRKRTEWEEKGEGKRIPEKKAPETFSAEKRCASLTCRSTSEGVLLVALLPSPPCRALLSRGPIPGARQASQHPQPLSFFQPLPQPQEPQALPTLLRVGEEYFLRLGNLDETRAAPLSPAASPLASRSSSRLSPDKVAANFFRALLQPRRPLDSPAGPAERGTENALGSRQEAPAARKRRSQEPPISLDLTFHLLREVLEMTKADQLAQQAHSNRKLLDIAGK